MNSIARLNKTAKALAVLGVVLTLAPYIYAFATPGGDRDHKVLFSVVLPLVLIPVGYFIQSLAGRILGFKRIDDCFDDKVRFVDIKACIIPLVLCALTFIPIFNVYRDYSMSTDAEIDLFSLHLYTVPLLCVLSLAVGVIMWFYPYGKLLNIDMVYFYGGAYLIVTIISLIFGVDMTLLTVCFLLFLMVFFTVSNLKSIEESIAASKFRIPANNFRRYNFELVIKHYFTTIVIALLVFSLLVLAVNSFSAPRFTPNNDLLTEEGVSHDGGDEAKEGGFYALMFNAEASGEKASFLEIFCGVVLCAGFLFFLLYQIYKKHLLKKFFYLVAMIFAGIKDLFYGILGIFYGRSNFSESLDQSYVDTELDVECVVNFSRLVPIEPLTRRSFEAKLNEKDSLEEKFAYAYSVYARLIRGHRYGIKASDTPRVINAKLTALNKDQLVNATPVYEEIRYREATPDRSVCKDELDSLVILVKELL